MKKQFAILAIVLWSPCSFARAQESIIPNTKVVGSENNGTPRDESSVPNTKSLKDVFEEDFLVGVAINRSITSGGMSRRSREDVEMDRELVKKQFNHVVAENDMKWQLIHPRPGEDGFEFGPADAFVEFGAKHGMQLAGHTLVWHSQTPNWVFEGSFQPATQAGLEPTLSIAGFEALTINPPRNPPPRNPPTGNGGEALSPGRPNATNPSEATLPSNEGGNNASGGGQGSRPRGPGRFGPGPGFSMFNLNGPRATREELLQRMRAHIHAVVGRYKGKIRVWDVVNEALADGGPEVLRRSPWSVIIGPDFIAKAFEYAHEADPDAILRYNDYGLENPDKRRRLVALIKTLQAQNVPIMAIGSQAHCNVSTTFEAMDQSLTEIEALGLPIHITELDVNSAVRGQQGTGADIAANGASTQGGLVVDSDKRLADAYAGLFKAFVKHKESIEVVTFWGVNDDVSWRAQGTPLLFNGRNAPKPAFDAVIALPKDAPR